MKSPTYKLLLRNLIAVLISYLISLSVSYFEYHGYIDLGIGWASMPGKYVILLLSECVVLSLSIRKVYRLIGAVAILSAWSFGTLLCIIVTSSIIAYSIYSNKNNLWIIFVYGLIIAIMGLDSLSVYHLYLPPGRIGEIIVSFIFTYTVLWICVNKAGFANLLVFTFIIITGYINALYIYNAIMPQQMSHFFYGGWTV